jgi:hypothetical protein
MASTPEGTRLTEQHRQTQQQVRNEFLAEFIALWAMLDSERLDETGPGWVAAVTRVVAAYRLLSARVATRYFYDFAAVEAPSTAARPRAGIELPPGADRPKAASSPTPPAAPSRRDNAFPRSERGQRRRNGRLSGQDRRPRGEDVIPEPRRSGVRFEVDEDAIERSLERTAGVRIDIPKIDWKPRDRATKVSLNVTGPVGQKSKVHRGKSLQVARDESFVEAAGAASRQVFEGGRQSLMKLVQDNDQLVGYIRVTDGDPCYFCAMLASRGPVYRTPKRAGPNQRGERNSRAGLAFVGAGGFKVHDHCACTIEPVFTSNTNWPGRGREFQQMWNDNIAKRYSGDDAIRAWRRLYERQQREQRRVSA